MNTLIEQVYDEYKNQLTKKGAKKNKRTKDDLLMSIIAEYDNVSLETDDQDEILDRLRMAAFTYMNEPLMFKLVRKFDNLPLPEEDRISAARVGFAIALNKFDPSLGFQFSTFAWRVISNEIIHANKLYLRPSMYKEKDRDIYAIDYGTVSDIIESKNARNVIYKGEKVIPHDVILVKGDREIIYPYIYNIQVVKGDNIVPGSVIGRTAGTIINIGSTNEILDSEDFGDVIFKNIIDSEEEFESDIDNMLMNEDVGDILSKGLDSLDELERYIIEARFLSSPKVPRHALSKELEMSEYRISKKEASALEKLEKILRDNNIKREDLIL